MACQNTVDLFCPAKLNLALSIGAADKGQGGMHPLASWMVALAYGDNLNVVRTASGQSHFNLSFDGHLAGDARPWALETDLAYRAHALLSEHVGEVLNVDVTVHKRILPGAGLGGGSSNAAGVLVALNQLFRLGLDTTCLQRLAIKLGSDVPFLVGALMGTASAVVYGFGQRLKPALRTEPIHLVLAMPPFGCSTPQVYKAFNQLHDTSKQADVDRIRSCAVQEKISGNWLFNDLAESACKVEPRLGEIRDQLVAMCNLPVHVTGSGSAMFMVVADAAAAKQLAVRISEQTGLKAIATHTI